MRTRRPIQRNIAGLATIPVRGVRCLPRTARGPLRMARGLPRTTRGHPRMACWPSQTACWPPRMTRGHPRTAHSLERMAHSKEPMAHSLERMAHSKERMIHSLERMAHSKERMIRCAPGLPRRHALSSGSDRHGPQRTCTSNTHHLSGKQRGARPPGRATLPRIMSESVLLLLPNAA